MEKAEALAARWRADTVGLSGGEAQWGALRQRYSEPHRHYHTLDHLAELFAHLDAYRARLRDPRAVAFAAWYHDAIYDTTRGDNEALSAEMAGAALDAMGYGNASAVLHMVLATKDHTAPPADADEALFLDADFAILGAAPARYESYIQQVRAEFGWVPDEGWRAGRLAFLTKASAVSRLFHTDDFELQFGGQARANIAWEMTCLGA
jgi:predicted metal-dependent HD superfamily phosphohydrolase